MDAVRKHIKHGQKILVVERAFSAGVGGIVSSNVRTALAGIDTHIYTAVAGLGGRPITLQSIRDLIDKALYGELADFSFVDMNVEIVQRELERNLLTRRSGALASGLLQDVIDHE
jgi:pyruvate ferredoxin oxidoreductase alpha subunit